MDAAAARISAPGGKAVTPETTPSASGVAGRDLRWKSSLQVHLRIDSTDGIACPSLSQTALLCS